ncbi:hypothetical protein ACHAWX_000344 [Stephanocyclus meneghinianus]
MPCCQITITLTHKSVTSIKKHLIVKQKTCYQDDSKGCPSYKMDKEAPLLSPLCCHKCQSSVL